MPWPPYCSGTARPKNPSSAILPMIDSGTRSSFRWMLLRDRRDLRSARSCAPPRASARSSSLGEVRVGRPAPRAPPRGRAPRCAGRRGLLDEARAARRSRASRRRGARATPNSSPCSASCARARAATIAVKIVADSLANGSCCARLVRVGEQRLGRQRLGREIGEALAVDLVLVDVAAARVSSRPRGERRVDDRRTRSGLREQRRLILAPSLMTPKLLLVATSMSSSGRVDGVRPRAGATTSTMSSTMREDVVVLRRVDRARRPARAAPPRPPRGRSRRRTSGMSLGAAARGGRAGSRGTSVRCEPERMLSPTRSTDSSHAVATISAGRQADAAVDDFHAGVAARDRDLLGAVRVTVEARLADQHLDRTAETSRSPAARARAPSPSAGPRCRCALRRAPPRCRSARGSCRRSRAARRPTRRS